MVPMATDSRLTSALLLAQREAAEGKLTPEAARQLLAAITGNPDDVPEVHAPRPADPALDDRDECLRRLADLSPSRSTWAAAGRVADWLRRWHAGDPLHDAPAGGGDLCAAVGRPLSQRQCFRILSGDRSA